MNPMRLLMFALWPLLVANVVLWSFYSHSSFMTAVWAIALVTSPKLLPDY